MKFAQSCMLAASMGAMTQAADISVVLTFMETDMPNDQTFQQEFLLQLQKDTTNTSSDCMVGFETLKTTYNQLVSNLESDAEYVAGLQAKGQGSGTSYGYAIDKFESYVDMATVSTNLFNECDIEYYLQAVSKAVSNVAGFVNQGINTYFRMQESTTFDEMETAFNVGGVPNTSDSARLLAQFFKDFLMAEIPDKASAGYYTNVGTLM